MKEMIVAPAFENVAATFKNFRATADPEIVIADLQIQGQVFCASCDMVPGANGRITKLHAYVNGALVSAEETGLPVASTKGPGSSYQPSFTSPYPFTGSFNVLVPDIELEVGQTSVRIEAKDPFLGDSGYYELEGDIAFSPTDIPITPLYGSTGGIMNTYYPLVKGPSDLLDTLYYTGAANLQPGELNRSGMARGPDNQYYLADPKGNPAAQKFRKVGEEGRYSGGTTFFERRTESRVNSNPRATRYLATPHP